MPGVPGAPGLRPWCQLAYWELADRVGRLYPVQGRFINVSSAVEPAQTHQGLCLETLANSKLSPSTVAVERTRAKIGLGECESVDLDLKLKPHPGIEGCIPLIRSRTLYASSQSPEMKALSPAQPRTSLIN